MSEVPLCPVIWAEQRQRQAARDGNLVDFENYQELVAMWKSKLGV